MTNLPHGALSPKSREAVAKVEIGQTTMTPAVARFLFVSFLVICCAVPLFELARAARGDAAARRPWAGLREIPGEAVNAGRDLRGSTWDALIASNRVVLEGLHEFEKSLEDESRLARSLRPGAQLLLSGTLGAGNEQAYVGRDGWLFYRPDVEFVTSRSFLDADVRQRRVRTAAEWTDPPQPDPRPAILQLHQQLQARGILLIVMPVPVKPTVHPEMLARRPAGVPNNPGYAPFVEELRGRGVIVFDPAETLREAGVLSGATQYLATDTHWRPDAMALVVERLADTIRMQVTLPPVADPGYRVEPVDVTHRGDVFLMLDLPARQTIFPAETVTVRRVLASDGSPWRSSPDADVLVLGDSFANIFSLESMGWGTGAGMVEQLSYTLNRPVDRMVQNDAGSYATREMLARAEPTRLAPKKVVIYQFAARELAFGDWKH